MCSCYRLRNVDLDDFNFHLLQACRTIFEGQNVLMQIRDFRSNIKIVIIAPEDKSIKQL